MYTFNKTYKKIRYPPSRPKHTRALAFPIRNPSRVCDAERRRTRADSPRWPGEHMLTRCCCGVRGSYVSHYGGQTLLKAVHFLAGLVWGNVRVVSLPLTPITLDPGSLGLVFCGRQSRAKDSFHDYEIRISVCHYSHCRMSLLDVAPGLDHHAKRNPSPTPASPGPRGSAWPINEPYK